MRYRYTILLLFIFIANGVNAQKKEVRLHLKKMDEKKFKMGYFLGMNYHDFRIDRKTFNESTPVIQDVNEGFSLGFMGDIKLTEYFQIRLEPGLYFANRNFKYPSLKEPAQKQRDLTASYVKIPVLLKINTLRYNNIRPYLVAGFSMAANFGSRQNTFKDNEEGVFRLKTFTGYLEVGTGMEFYFEYFKFGISLRGVYGLTNELVADNDPNSPWTGNITGLYTRGFLLNLTFQ